MFGRPTPAMEDEDEGSKLPTAYLHSALVSNVLFDFVICCRSNTFISLKDIFSDVLTNYKSGLTPMIVRFLSPKLNNNNNKTTIYKAQ